MIFLISTLQYELFEKRLLQTKRWIVGALFIGILILVSSPQGLGIFTKISNHPAIALNEQIAENCKENDRVVQCRWDSEMLQVAKKPTADGAYFCSYDGPGDVTALFTGNSFALRQIVGVKKALQKHYKKIYLAARPACLVFEDFNDSLDKQWQCDELYNKTAEFVAKLNPDFLIITQMLAGNPKFASPVTLEQARNDETTRILAEHLKVLSAYVKNIFIIEPHPKFNYHPASKLAQLLSQDKPTDDVVQNYEDWKTQIDPAWNRLLAAMETCPKCVPIQIRDLFCQNDTCDLYEPETKLSLYCDAAHFSPHGVQRLVPILREKFFEAIKNFVPQND
uniref:SGNH domain-containing protein n=1 Tax=Panagrolaimus sp. JU765 TaxID=591449 RepID=A0AC34Q3C7_9BILA